MSTAAKGTIYLTISSTIFMISGYAVNLILGRTLGPTGYGVYGVVISFMSTINIIQIAGVPRSLSKYLSENKYDQNALLASAFKLQIIISLTLSTLFFLSAPAIASLLNDQSLTPYLKLVALIFPAYSFYSYTYGFFNGKHLFKKQAVIHVAYSVFKIVFVIGFSLVFGLFGAIIGFVVSPLFALFFGLKIPKRTNKVFPSKKLITYSAPLIIFAVFTSLLQTIDLYFVKALLPDAEAVGFYAANQNIARIPYFSLSAFALVLFPSISNSVSSMNHVKTQSLIKTSIRYVLIILAPITVLISATSASVLTLLFSSAYTSGAPSLSILIFGISFLTLMNVFANILSGAGHPTVSVAVSAIGIAITSVFAFFFVPLYGLTGAAISTSLGTLSSAVLAGYIVRNKFGSFLPVKSIFKIGISSSLIYIAALLLPKTVLLLPAEYLALSLMYIGSLFLLGELNKKDLDIALSLWTKKL